MKQKVKFVLSGSVIIFLKFFILVIVMLLFSHLATSASNVSVCGTIGASGDYVLNQSITATGRCLLINVGNVHLDCQGHNITYATGGGNGLIGIDATSATITQNLTIKNCNIGDYNTGGTTGYGIRLQRFSNSTIFNNTIHTSGISNSYGIYILTSSQNNTIEDNTIYALGSTTGNIGIVISGAAGSTSDHNILLGNSIHTIGTTGNHGIYLSANVGSTNISYNNIIAFGNNTNYGIYLAGTAVTTPVNSTYIFNNSIQTYGNTAGSDYGIYLQNYVARNVIIGNTIDTNGSTTANYGVYLFGTAALSPSYNVVDSNMISTQGTTTNYGVYLNTNVNYNNITDNNINTTGTTTNVGIVIAGTALSTTMHNNIFNNIIRTNGSGANNYGIYLLTNSTFNNISSNDIITNGTTTNHGIYLVGAALNTSCNDNYIFNNSIQTFGTAGVVSSYGVWLQNSVLRNDIIGNNINTHGSTANYGVYLVGTAAFSPSYNTVDSNIIFTQGNATNNYGVYLLTNTDFNNVTYNTINTNGTTGNVGVVINGTTSANTFNNIQSNTIRSSGTGANNHGIYLLVNSNLNNISDNDIITNGTATSYGIYLLGTAIATPVINNEVSLNSIQTKCSAASSLCHGIYFQNVATNNTILRNSITTGGTDDNYGIFLVGTAALPLSFTTIDSNTLDVSGADCIDLATGVSNITIRNNTIIDRDYIHYDINISAAGVNRTSFIDQYFERYTFAGIGGMITVENSDFGKVVFLKPVNGTGANFSKDVAIDYNYIYVNSTQKGLNQSANLTLYGLAFSNPRILRDGVVCKDCTILDYTSGDLLFNVTGFSNYTAGESSPPVIDLITINDSVSPANEIILSAGGIRTVNCSIVASDILGASDLIGANATFYFYQNTSSDPDNNNVHYTDAPCDISPINSTHAMFSCFFDVLYYANNGTWICNVTVYNNQSMNSSANISAIVDPLYAVNITDGIDFSNVIAGFPSNNVTVNITNFGNMPVDVTLQGYALVIGDNTGMNCSDNTNITITNIRFSTNNTASFAEKIPMDGSIQPINFIINKQTNSTQIFNTTYWQVSPDAGKINRICNGYVIFSAESP